MTNPIDDYEDGIPTAPPTAYSSPSKGGGPSKGYGGYGKIALGGYAGPPAAEQVMTTDDLSHPCPQTSTCCSMLQRAANVTGGVHLSCSAASTVGFA